MTTARVSCSTVAFELACDASPSCCLCLARGVRVASTYAVGRAAVAMTVTWTAPASRALKCAQFGGPAGVADTLTADTVAVTPAHLRHLAGDWISYQARTLAGAIVAPVADETCAAAVARFATVASTVQIAFSVAGTQVITVRPPVSFSALVGTVFSFKLALVTAKSFVTLTKATVATSAATARGVWHGASRRTAGETAIRLIHARALSTICSRPVPVHGILEARTSPDQLIANALVVARPIGATVALGGTTRTGEASEACTRTSAVGVVRAHAAGTAN